MKRSTALRLTLAVAVLVAIAVVVRLAGGGFMATLRRMHGHP
jgi:hypothetical protein